MSVAGRGSDDPLAGLAEALTRLSPPAGVAAGAVARAPSARQAGSQGQGGATGPTMQGGQGSALDGVRGVGTAAGGKARAEVSASGRLEVLTIDPTVFRSGVVSVADLVLEAVQAAQDSAAEQVKRVIAAVPAAAPDREGLSAAAAAAEAGMVRLDEMMAQLGRLTTRLDGGPR